MNSVKNKPYAEYARRLKLSAFFKSLPVWMAAGKNEYFLKWVKKAPCCICNKSSDQKYLINFREYCHTILDDYYNKLPLCKKCYNKVNAPRSNINKDVKRIITLQRWCCETLKNKLGYDSWAEIPPSLLIEWAREHEVENYLPRSFREYIE